jgi:hypothetical protein
MGEDCDTLYSLPRGSLVKIMLTSIETDPAARAAILLTSIAAIRRCRQEPVRCAALLGLRGYAMNCIQAATSDPGTRYGNGTAVAMVSMGNFERYYGCEQASGAHTQGLACLRHVRGASIDWVLDSVLSWMQTIGAADVSRSTSVVLERFIIGT